MVMTIRMTKTMDTFCQRNAQRGHDYYDYGDDVNDYDEEEGDNDDDEDRDDDIDNDNDDDNDDDKDKDDDKDNDNDDDKRYFSTAARLSQLFEWHVFPLAVVTSWLEVKCLFFFFQMKS